jgi:hypothetical protein
LPCAPAPESWGRLPVDDGRRHGGITTHVLPMLVTAREAAEIRDITAQHVYNMASHGRLRRYAPTHTRRQYDLDELEEMSLQRIRSPALGTPTGDRPRGGRRAGRGPEPRSGPHGQGEDPVRDRSERATIRASASARRDRERASCEGGPVPLPPAAMSGQFAPGLFETGVRAGLNVLVAGGTRAGPQRRFEPRSATSPGHSAD